MPSPRSRADLNQEIERISNAYSGEIGLAAKNLKTGEEVQVNADAVFPTASTIKLSILVEVFAQAEEGKLRLDERMEMAASDRVGGSGILKVLGGGLQPTIYDIATLMIVLSDNTATNMLIDRVGGVDAVNQRIHGTYGLDSVVLHNRVDFERIGSDVRRFAEATPSGLMGLMEKMVRGELVSKAASDEMLAILGRQQYLDQAPRYINFSPYAQELKLDQPISVACKTGFFPGTGVDAGAIALPEETAIAYCMVAHGSTDTSVAYENESSVTNGLLGRALVRYWWPGDDLDAATFPTRYAEE